MNSAPSWIYPGAPVWARMGFRAGWSLAVVVRISLWPRNPELKGKDKPRPGDALASPEVN